MHHNNKQLKYNSSDWEIDERIDRQEQDIVLQKKHGNAFLNTDLKQILLDAKIKAITIGGLVSHGCDKASCFGGLSEGFEASVLKNGHTNWNKDADNKISQTEYELMKKGILLDDFK